MPGENRLGGAIFHGRQGEASGRNNLLRFRGTMNAGDFHGAMAAMEGKRVQAVLMEPA